jgi:apolipoprotein N-acyltransferase
MLEALGGRKFLLTLIVIAVGTAVQILSPHGVTEAFTALLIGVTATFGASNAFLSAKFAGVQSEQVASPPTVDVAAIQHEIENSLELAKSAMGAATEAHSLAQQADQSATYQSEAIAKLQEGQELTQKLVKMAIQIKQ